MIIIFQVLYVDLTSGKTTLSLVCFENRKFSPTDFPEICQKFVAVF